MFVQQIEAHLLADRIDAWAWRLSRSLLKRAGSRWRRLQSRSPGTVDRLLDCTSCRFPYSAGENPGPCSSTQTYRMSRRAIDNQFVFPRRSCLPRLRLWCEATAAIQRFSERAFWSINAWFSRRS